MHDRQAQAEGVLAPIPYLSIIYIFFFSRILCGSLIYWGHSNRIFLELVPGGWEGVPNWLINPWTTYDSIWYLQIASQGYQVHTTAFFPLYPLILRLFGPDSINMALAGVVISNVSFFIALVLIYRLTTLEWGENVALTTLWVIALCPAAPFFGAVYTESLFIALMAATFLAARRHHWWLAGLAGGAAALLRNPGFLIAGALLLEAWQNRQDKRLAKWITWLIPLGAFIGVQVYFWVRFGNPMAGLDSQGYFHRTLDWPWVPLLGDLRILINGNYNFGIFLVTISGLLFTLLGLASPFIGWRKISLGYYLLIFGITLMNLVYARQIPPYTISATRYLASLFPVAQMIALSFVKIQNSQAKLLFFGLYFFVFVMFNLMFGDKGFLG